MRNSAPIRLRLLLLVCAAMLMRAVIPAGYMPAAAGSGLLFEPCPEGMPAGFVQAFSGDSQHHHDHGEKTDDADLCQLGHMLLSATAIDDAWQADIVQLPQAHGLLPVIFRIPTFQGTYHSRGPPA